MEITSRGVEKFLSKEVHVFRTVRDLCIAFHGDLLEGKVSELDSDVVPFVLTTQDSDKYFMVRRKYRIGDTWHTEDKPLKRGDRISLYEGLRQYFLVR